MTSVEHLEDSAEHEAGEGEVVKGGEGWCGDPVKE